MLRIHFAAIPAEASPFALSFLLSVAAQRQRRARFAATPPLLHAVRYPLLRCRRDASLPPSRPSVLPNQSLSQRANEAEGALIRAQEAQLEADEAQAEAAVAEAEAERALDAAVGAAQ